MQWIEKCIHSLISSSIPVEIVVIDNGSKDQTIKFVRDNFPYVSMVETGKNNGFGFANNIGLKIARANNADFVFLLNQDAWVEKDTIVNLITAQKENPEFGIISPLHMNGSGSALDLYFRNYLIASSSIEFVSTEKYNQSGKKNLINAKFVNAAAWLISKSCLTRTGDFDPIFFHYGEDWNYIHRAIYWGFKVGICSRARIYHDREDRILSNQLSNKQQLQKDWIQLLTHACNIQESGYGSLLFRRFLRYSLQGLGSLASFNQDGIWYNFSMAKRIAQSISDIRKCRARSLNGFAYENRRLNHIEA